MQLLKLLFFLGASQDLWSPAQAEEVGRPLEIRAQRGPSGVERTHPNAANHASKNATPAKASPGGQPGLVLSPNEQAEFDRSETYFRNTYRFPRVAFVIPLGPNGQPQPHLSINGKTSSKQRWGSQPLPIIPNLSGPSNPIAPSVPNLQTNPPGSPIPGQTVPDGLTLLPPTPANPNLPDVSDIINWLNWRWPDDTRRNLIFWTGTGQGRAVAIARNSQLLGTRRWTLSEIIGRRYQRYISRSGRDWADILPMWQRLSLALALWAEGDVVVLIGDDDHGEDPLNVWNAVERPTLEHRGIHIQWRDANGAIIAAYPPIPGTPGVQGPLPQTPPRRKIPAQHHGPITITKSPLVVNPKYQIPVLATRDMFNRLSKRHRRAILRRALMLKSKVHILERQMRDRTERISRLREYIDQLARRGSEGYESSFEDFDDKEWI